MGITVNAFSIILGAFLGSIFKERIKLQNFTVLGISIMIISLVGFFENIYGVSGLSLESSELLVVVFALIVGTVIGDFIKLDTRISNLSSLKKDGFSVLIDSSIFFGVGGLQICGPMLLATMGDSSQLLLKSVIDFPFALMFGISYGKKVAFSSIPVAVGQTVIFLMTMLSKNFFDDSVIRQMCAMGYIILFFSGFNLICDKKNKINNVNMIIGIFIILVYNIIKGFWRAI